MSQTYKWEVVRRFHDAVVKSWERGLTKLPETINDESLEKYKKYYFDAAPNKLRNGGLKNNEVSFGLNVSVFLNKEHCPKDGYRKFF